MTPAKGRATPGPWRAEFGTHSGYDCMTAAWNINSVPQGGTICVVDYGDYGSNHFDTTPNPQADANARLIAASPMLLEAVKFAAGFVARHKRKDDGMNLHEQLLDAIRATKGE